MRKHSMQFAIAAAAAAVVAAFTSSAKAQALTGTFTQGDIVVLQDGDATNTVTADAGGTTTAYLDEYAPNSSGGLTFVGTLAVPSSTSGSNNPLTLTPGGGSHEGVLTLSENGNYLTFAGYDQGVSASSPGTNAANGTIAIVGNNVSSLNTSTLVTGGQAMRAAVTTDGNEFYLAEAHASASPNPGGLNYVSGTGSGATQTILNDLLDPRSVQILGGANPSTAVLAAGSGSSSFYTTFGGNATYDGHGVYQVTASSGGLPTNSSMSGANIANADDGSDIVFANEPGDANSYHGYNVMFLAGNTSSVTGLVEKFEYTGSNTFTSVGYALTSGSQNPSGITDIVDPFTGKIDVFYTEANGVYELTTADSASAGFDNSGVANLVASPGIGAEFDGVADAPSAVPEPTSLGLLCLGSLGLLARRRRQA